MTKRLTPRDALSYCDLPFFTNHLRNGYKKQQPGLLFEKKVND